MKKYNGKKCLGKKRVFKKLLGITALAGTVSCGTAYMLYQRNKKEMEARSDKNNLVYTTVGGRLSLDSKSDTDNIFVSCAGASVVLDMTREPVVHDVLVNMFALAGTVKILVPDNVKVDFDTDVKLGYTVSVADNPVDPEAPIVHVTGTVFAGGVTVKRLYVS